jgi:hypothetical protein
MAELSLLQRQRRQLKASARLSEEREARESAPSRLENRLEAFPDLLAEAEAALEAFQEAREKLEEAGQEIVEARKLVGDDADGLTPAQFRRWGLLAATVPGEPGERLTSADSGGPPRRQLHLFRTTAQQRAREKALQPPSEALVEATRRQLREKRDRKIGYAGTPPKIDDRRVLQAVEDARRKAIISGEFEVLEPVEA